MQFSMGRYHPIKLMLSSFARIFGTLCQLIPDGLKRGFSGEGAMIQAPVRFSQRSYFCLIFFFRHG